MPMAQITPSLVATIAEYFRLGLTVGLLTPEAAQAWALSLVERMDEPPGEVIEVGWSKGLHATLEALAGIPGERDTHLAGGWLIGQIRAARPFTYEHLCWASTMALRVFELVELDDDLHHGLRRADAMLGSSPFGMYPVPECRQVLYEVLDAFPWTPDLTAGP